jgi:glutaredoxin
MPPPPPKKKYIQETIARSSVLVYSKSYCPHSQRAKKILREVLQSASANDHDNHDGGAGEEEEGTVEILQVVELDELGGRGVQIQTYLAELTHQRTVPNVCPPSSSPSRMLFPTHPCYTYTPKEKSCMIWSLKEIVLA